MEVGPCYRVGVAHIQRPGTTANLSPVSGSWARSFHVSSPHRSSHSPACIYVPTYLVRAASPPSHASRDSRNPQRGSPVRKICRNSSCVEEGNPPPPISSRSRFRPPFFFFSESFSEREGVIVDWMIGSRENN